MNEYNPQGKDIRFIDSHYKELFRVPDGGTIQISDPYETVIKKCEFVDEYHTQIGCNVFHICEFAEIMERNGRTYQPEPEIFDDEAAWKVGRDKYLALQTCEDGYDYTILNGDFSEVDGGQLDMPELSMMQARTEILDAYHLSAKDLVPVDYENLMEEMFQKDRQAVVIDDPAKIKELENGRKSFIYYVTDEALRVGTFPLMESDKPIDHTTVELQSYENGDIKAYGFLEYPKALTDEQREKHKLISSKDNPDFRPDMCEKEKDSVRKQLLQMKEKIAPPKAADKNKEPER